MSKENKDNNISLSSVKHQRDLRIKRMEQLEDFGYNTFAVNAKRDYSLSFMKFWASFVNKIDLQKLEKEIKPYTLEYFLYQVILPKDLVGKAEEMLRIRKAVKDMGIDPDDEEIKKSPLDNSLVIETRKLFKGLAKISKHGRYSLLKEYFIFSQDDNKLIDTSYKKGQKITLSGRVKSKRVAGKIAFATIEDESNPDGFQFIFKKDNLAEDQNLETIEEYTREKPKSMTLKNFAKLIDEGDYIEAIGIVDFSNTEEPSLFVEDFKILTKALRPLPETLDYENLEERYSNRVVDFKMNTKDNNGLSVRNLMRLKSRFWQIWREEMLGEGFLEVECPVFETTPGGADASPFVTYYNELGQDVYMRISLELPLKRLIAGGFEKVFEIGRIFRNEGSSPQHLQEYTQIEWYWAYSDYTDGMKFMKRVFQRIIKELKGSLIQTDYYGNTINWGEWCTEKEAKKNGWELIGGWPMIPYFEAIRHFSGGKVDLEGKNRDQMLKIANTHNIEIEQNAGYSKVMDTIYKKMARVNMHNPFFLTLPPVEIEPLAKRNPEKQELTERFQIVAGTAELGKGFSELNDPIDQYNRFENQQAARDAGDDEAHFMNEDYVKALEYGLPPLSGWGSSERLFSFLFGKHIKECVTFPHVRNQEQKSKSKKTLSAHIVVFNDSKTPQWVKMNTVAHLSASMAARKGKDLIDIEGSNTKDGTYIPMNIQHAIVIKEEKENNKVLLELKQSAEEKGLTISLFTQDMQDSSDDKKVNVSQESKNIDDIKILGILIFGEKKIVEELTKSFNLLS